MRAVDLRYTNVVCCPVSEVKCRVCNSNMSIESNTLPGVWMQVTCFAMPQTKIISKLKCTAHTFLMSQHCYC